MVKWSKMAETIIKKKLEDVNDFDLVDWSEKWDDTLSISENLTQLDEQGYSLMFRRRTESDRLHDEYQEYLARKSEMPFGDDSNWINKSSAHCVIGRRGVGKTAFDFKLLEFADKPVYFFRHPKPHLLEPFGYKNFNDLYDLTKMKDCIVVMDEPQLTIKVLSHKANDTLERILSIARHNDITVVLSTSDTRFVTRGLESWIDCWMVMDIDPHTIKQGSLVKKIIRTNSHFGGDEFRLDKGEFLFYSREFKNLNGQHRFKKPETYTEEMSKSFRHEDEKPDQTGDNTESESPKEIKQEVI